MGMSTTAETERPARRSWSWYRLGDLGLCFLLMLFATIKGEQTIKAAHAGDWLEAIYQGLVGLTQLISAVLPVVRRAAVARGTGLLPKGIAMIGSYAIIPLALVPLTWRPDWLLTAATIGLVLVEVWVAWALLTLRRSFSVFPEARALVTRGPYGIVRHPLYAAYVISYALVALPRLSVVAVLIALCGMGAEVMRARREEQVLGGVFPDYAVYAKRVPAFWPRFARWPATVASTAVRPAEAHDPGEQLVA